MAEGASLHLRHIVAATDESDMGRQAVRSSVELAKRAGGRLTVIHAVPVSVGQAPVAATVTPDHEHPEAEHPAVIRLRHWIGAELPARNEPPPVSLGVAFGVPGIEITRFAERRDADLLVLGRKPRSQMARLLMGDTADAVARRSRIPCFFIPPRDGFFRRMLVALDGTERGMAVLHAACGFAQSLGVSFSVVTVDTSTAGEPVGLAAALPGARSARLQGRVQAILVKAATACPAWTRSQPAHHDVDIRHGDVVEEVLAAVEDTQSDVLVIGYHRGGLPGILEAGSTARRLAHLAPCAVLTIPL